MKKRNTLIKTRVRLYISITTLFVVVFALTSTTYSWLTDYSASKENSIVAYNFSISSQDGTIVRPLNYLNEDKYDNPIDIYYTEIAVKRADILPIKKDENGKEIGYEVITSENSVYEILNSELIYDEDEKTVIAIGILFTYDRENIDGNLEFVIKGTNDYFSDYSTSIVYSNDFYKYSKDNEIAALNFEERDTYSFDYLPTNEKYEFDLVDGTAIIDNYKLKELTRELSCELKKTNAEYGNLELSYVLDDIDFEHNVYYKTNFYLDSGREFCPNSYILKLYVGKNLPISEMPTLTSSLYDATFIEYDSENGLLIFELFNKGYGTSDSIIIPNTDALNGLFILHSSPSNFKTNSTEITFNGFEEEDVTSYLLSCRSGNFKDSLTVLENDYVSSLNLNLFDLMNNQDLNGIDLTGDISIKTFIARGLRNVKVLDLQDFEYNAIYDIETGELTFTTNVITSYYIKCDNPYLDLYDEETDYIKSIQEYFDSLTLDDGVFILPHNFNEELIIDEGLNITLYLNSYVLNSLINKGTLSILGEGRIENIQNEGVLSIEEGYYGISVENYLGNHCYQEEVDGYFKVLKSEHNYESIVIEPTCLEDGKEIFTCSICKDEYIKTIEELGHDFVNGACSRCEEKEVLDE